MRWLSPPDSVPEARDEREIFEPDVDQELQPVADFLEHARPRSRSACVLSCGGSSANHSPARLIDMLGDFADVLAGDLDAQRLGLEPVAVAGVAGDVGEIFRDLLARPVALGLLVSGARDW